MCLNAIATKHAGVCVKRMWEDTHRISGTLTWPLLLSTVLGENSATATTTTTDKLLTVKSQKFEV